MINFNFNNFSNSIKKNVNFINNNENYNKDINSYDFRNIILNKYNLLKKIYFKNLYEYLNYIKKNKFKQYIDFKDIIYEYNQNLPSINNCIYNYKYLTFNLESIDNEIDIIIPQTEIYPYKIINFFYNYKEISRKNLNEENIKNYKIKGLICFLVFKKTKIKEEIKLLVISNEIHNDDLYVINILDLIKKINYNLYKNIKRLKKYFYNKWLNYCEYCKKKYVKNDENYLTNVYVGALCTLSLNKENISKKDILEYLYYNDILENNLHLHLYFELYQYSKQTNKYSVNLFNSDINSFLEENNILHISYNLEKLNSEFNFSIGLYKDDKISLCFLNFKNVYKYKVDENMSLSTYYNNLISNKILQVDIDKKIILNYKNLIKVNLSEILYSNFLNKNKKYNYNNIYLSDKEIYIPDIITKYKNDINKNIIYTELQKKYIIKKNDIIIKKKKNIYIEKLINIDNNNIKWVDFIECSNENIILNLNLENFFIWFKKTFNIYQKKNLNDAMLLKNIFIYTNIDKIFFKTMFIEMNKENVILLHNFLFFYQNNFTIINNEIKNIKNITEINFDYLFFIEILKIIFFLNT